jgi:hypothetical protein
MTPMTNIVHRSARAHVPRAIRALASGRKVRIELEDGREVGFPAQELPCLRNARDDLQGQVRVEARGKALRWEERDEDTSVAGILVGRFGPRS